MRRISKLDGNSDATLQNEATGGLVERAVIEAIDSLATPKVRNALLALALRWAQQPHIPERGARVGEFVSGALFAAAEQVLGLNAAESIEDQLMPVALMVADDEVSSVRPSRPAAPNPDDAPELSWVLPPVVTPPSGRQRPALATDPAPAHTPIVVIASTDPNGVEQVTQVLAGVATVHVVGDALAILDELAFGTAMVVVDLRRPVVSVETLLALGPELPSQTPIVLWGERMTLETDLEAIGISLPSSWVCCGPLASAMDVGAVCRVLLD